MSSLIGEPGVKMRRRVTVNLARLADIAAELVPKHVRERLARNLDVNGQSFTPLDEDTLRLRASNGRSPGQILSGAPFELRELRREVSEDRLKVTFGASNADLRRIGGYHQTGEGHNPERRWAGVSREGLRELVREALREGVMREET